MDTIEKLVAELHDIISNQLTLHTVDSVKSLLEDMRIKIKEIEDALEAGVADTPVPEGGVVDAPTPEATPETPAA